MTSLRSPSQSPQQGKGGYSPKDGELGAWGSLILPDPVVGGCGGQERLKQTIWGSAGGSG